MGPILTTVVGFIPSILGKVYDYFKTKSDRAGELSKYEHERKLAVEQRLRELALDKSAKDSLWALEQIKKSDKWMRRTSFVLLWVPLIAGAFYPVEVKQYFDNVLMAVPDWYIMIFGGMMMAVWGIRELYKFWSK